ncbi:MAG: DM13 domain-containing protein [Desertifilum sp. SIO1I2]|nr:DM13 domain-containing protein [Desertifilum sp. SIO1I2]
MHRLPLLSLAALLGFSSVPGALALPAVTGQIAQMPQPSGMFVAAEHPTQGMAKIVTVNGKRYLEFDSNFKTDPGPDLFVLLHRSSKPERYESGDYISLGDLQKVNGMQRYEIPANVNLSNYQSVVVWCRQFNATFGYAPLSARMQRTQNN